MARRDKTRKSQAAAAIPSPAPPPPPTPGAGRSAEFGSAGQRPSMAATPPKKTRHAGWLVSGLVLVTLSGLGALFVALSLVDEVTVLAAARDIAPDETIERSDLTEVKLPSRLGDVGIPVIAAAGT